MYICGHPGTGKTSTLNYVLTNIVSGDIKASLLNQVQVWSYNAMTFKDVKQFCIQLVEEVSQKLTGAPYEGPILKKGDFDDDDMGNLVAKTLSNKPKQTKIIVIDEIDAFEAHENSFRAFARAVLTSKDANTLIIGIANSVDLPFKKKHSAIAMRDT